MRKEHPLWRGFWLAASLTLLMAMQGHIDGSSLYTSLLSLFPTPAQAPLFPFILAGAAMIGAFLAALPRRLRKQSRRKTTLSGCALGFLGGLGSVLGLGIAGGGVVSGLMQGSASACIFALCAWIPGWIALRLWERRRV